ncbi:MAG TPA: YhjD/YihY/BrkB family envelope integrity protein [bacterium]|nr:YhjD/YihY/BrkB family envelope integrity protein [bacterium]
MVSKRISRLIKILSGAAANAEDEIFQLEDRLERFVHFWVLVIRQFIRHRCLVRASALSYSTLIALIPLLAVALSVTSSLLKTQDKEQFQHAMEKFVASVTPPAPINTDLLGAGTNAVEPTVTVTNFTITASTNLSGTVETTTNVTFTSAPAPVVTVTAQKAIASQVWGFVQNTQSGALGATGVVLLIFVAISLLSRIEETFNDIWGVSRGRNWLTQIQLYSTTIILGPVLLLAALSLAGSAHFESARNLVTHMPVIGKLIFQLLPLLVLWLAFAFVYQLVPNTKVNFSAAFIGGSVAGTLWHLNNLFGFLFVSRVVNNVNFYGSLGLIPVFMIGLYFSWVFLLLGAQIAYAFQNRAAYLQDRLADNINQRGREFVALRIMTTLGQRFQNGLRPATVLQLSTELGIPSRLTISVLRTLAHTRLVTEVSGVEAAYVPARPLETINAYDILNALRTGNGQELPVRAETLLADIYGEFARIEQAERHAASSVSLLALAQRMPLAPALTEAKAIRTEKQIPDVEIIAEPQEIETAPAADEPAPAPVNPPTRIQSEPAEKQSEAKKVSTPPADKPAIRREVVMPEENREFPL